MIQTKIFYEESYMNLNEKLNAFYKDNNGIQIISTSSAGFGRGLTFSITYIVDVENIKK